MVAGRTAGAGRVSFRLLVVVSLGYAAFAALVSYLFTLQTGRSLWTLQPDPSARLWYVVTMNVIVWGSWGLLAPGVLLLAARVPFGRTVWRRALVVHVTGSLCVTVVHVLITSSGRWMLQRLAGMDVAWGELTHDAFFRTLDVELPLYWALVGVSHAIDYHHEAKDRAVREAQLEASLAHARLQALERQLHPHFLFNTLHAISALIHRDPEAADRMLEQVGALLRAALKRGSAPEVTLAEEASLLEKYLNIERVQLGDRLQVTVSLDPDVLGVAVPPLLLQPIVENAVQHGIAPRAGPGRVDVGVRRHGDLLLIVVADNGIGVSGHEVETLQRGVGLSNTQARLAHLYGDAQRMRFRPTPGGGLTVEITIPFKILADTPPSARDDRPAISA